MATKQLIPTDGRLVLAATTLPDGWTSQADDAHGAIALEVVATSPLAERQGYEVGHIVIVQRGFNHCVLNDGRRQLFLTTITDIEATVKNEQKRPELPPRPPGPPGPPGQQGRTFLPSRGNTEG